jgi:hypothetical protein
VAFVGLAVYVLIARLLACSPFFGAFVAGREFLFLFNEPAVAV